MDDFHELVRQFAAHVLPMEHDVRAVEHRHHRRTDDAPRTPNQTAANPTGM